jgi:hypothetical protein
VDIWALWGKAVALLRCQLRIICINLKHIQKFAATLLPARALRYRYYRSQEIERQRTFGAINASLSTSMSRSGEFRDPSRDTPQQLATFLGSFDPRIRGLTGDETEIRRLAQTLGAYARRVGAGADYAFDHSGAGYLLDRPGRLNKCMDDKLTGAESVALMRRAIRAAE